MQVLRLQESGDEAFCDFVLVNKWCHFLRGIQGFGDASTKALNLKGVTIGEGDQKLRDVIYGRPPFFVVHTPFLIVNGAYLFIINQHVFLRTMKQFDGTFKMLIVTRYPGLTK